MSPRTKSSADSAGEPFNLTDAVRDLCVHLTRNLSELRHIEMSRVAVGFAQARAASAHGVQATLTPMRFAGGAPHERRRGRRWTIERMFDAGGREYLYLLRVYLPRFQNLPPLEKLITVLHELWHISPEFDGDLRRHPGRCYIHTHSQAEYDRNMEVLARRWLAENPPSRFFELLNHDFGELTARHGGVIGARIRPPRLLAS